jgi:hypothetical protein
VRAGREQREEGVSDRAVEEAGTGWDGTRVRHGRAWDKTQRYEF